MNFITLNIKEKEIRLSSLGIRALFAAFLVWRTVPLLSSYEIVSEQHNVSNFLIITIAIWEIAASVLFVFPKTILLGGIGLLGVFLVAAGVSIHADQGYFHLIIYEFVVIILYAGSRYIRSSK